MVYDQLISVQTKTPPAPRWRGGVHILEGQPGSAAVRAAARTGTTGRAGTHGTHSADIAENLVEQAAMATQRRGLVTHG